MNRWMTDWLIDWLIDWITNWLIDWIDDTSDVSIPFLVQKTKNGFKAISSILSNKLWTLKWQKRNMVYLRAKKSSHECTNKK